MATTEKEVLQLAASLIENALIENNEIKIPGFGKFYISMVTISKRFGNKEGVTRVVRFKPFTGLKKAVNDDSGKDYVSVKLPEDLPTTKEVEKPSVKKQEKEPLSQKKPSGGGLLGGFGGASPLFGR